MIATLSYDTTAHELQLLDQRILPSVVEYVTCRTSSDVAQAIATMVVRGAPAIGVTAAYGVLLGAREAMADNDPARAMSRVFDSLAASRPTAVNLFWALERMRQVYLQHSPLRQSTLDALQCEALRIHQQDVEDNRCLGDHGAQLLPDRGTVLTHCNAGALATAGYGTALGVIRSAVAMGKELQVYATETRPFLQGARLTAFELQQDRIPVTLICDNMVGAMMAQGKIQSVVVGADRIAANGDTANKIGTYGIAVLAMAHGVPFYVAAPSSTIDRAMTSGKNIVIEQREPSEVTHFMGYPVAPEGIAVENPSFDLTPAKYISAIITERGVLKPPFAELKSSC
ncbi:S-methyl-5-thioribose-1-phosphate isomerase [Desulfurispira natronophila]|uniref:Methylthioribose-1-phosphate isomerase n=1 Tax=Desulfurispira natronophila TaxID=682562 RepID=A0A7W7Y4E5_9BACT|nr:S-methyl-5-thioribose-1-phosphate isomerase [Desulfurispira natronophila]MBB5021832.1 methylthioribose-1-phosphate isomerase [Desulfurispira natronophila]